MQLGPNVSVSANARIGPGVRLIACIILDDVEVKVLWFVNFQKISMDLKYLLHFILFQENAIVLHSIIGWKSSIGKWARVQVKTNLLAFLVANLVIGSIIQESITSIKQCDDLSNMVVNAGMHSYFHLLAECMKNKLLVMLLSTSSFPSTKSCRTWCPLCKMWHFTMLCYKL